MHQSCASRLSDRETIGEQSFKLPMPDRSHGDVSLLSEVEATYLKGGGGEVGRVGEIPQRVKAPTCHQVLI